MSNCTKTAERVVPDDFHIWAKAPDEEFDFRIDRSKIKHHYTTFVEFTPVSPEEEARRHADAMNSVKSGIMSTHTARRRYWSHLDTEAEDIRTEAERLRNSEPVMTVMAQIVAQALAGEAARLMKINQLKAGQSPDQAALSGQGMAQAMSAQNRPIQGAYRPRQPGSVEEMMAQAAQAGIQSTGGQIRMPGQPSNYGEFRPQ